MYINRLIDSELERWRKSQVHKPVLLRGARQVGKSSSVRHLGESFEKYIEVNFEKRPELKRLFAEIHDVKELAARLGQLYNTSIVPGNTLLFLDEIQACEDALKTLWFFKEDFPELHVIAAGSLLEFTLKSMSAYGVGRIRSMFMYPLSFDEFLTATGHLSWIEARDSANADTPLFEALHNDIVQLFRSYLIVGGMPSSVVAWVTSRDYLQCAAEQDDILQSYYDDFAKYGSRVNTSLLRNTLQSAVLQVGKKFVYSKVEGEYNSKAVKEALGMLCDAGLLKPVQCTAANGIPLGAETNPKFRKYIYLDSGLLLRMLDFGLGGSQNLTQLILAGSASDLVNKGSLAEMVAGWELVKYSNSHTQHDLYYWENISEGATSEVDYVIAKDMKPLPIEVKSGTSGKMKSLAVYMTKKGLTEAVRTSLENFGMITQKNGKERHIKIIPLYALSRLVKPE
ncbi:MAG: ATP-binding protein [Bacteroidales bacterium]|nr:ATP-binding protein [Bacteroidales bacterium]